MRSSPGPQLSHRLSLALLLGAFGGAACDGARSTSPSDESGNSNDNGLVCTTQVVAGINVVIVDSLTNRTPAYFWIWARARDGAYVDSTRTPYSSTGGLRVALAPEHRGTHEVTVQVSGYQPWVKSGVVVTGDQCHVRTVLLTARVVR